ncbi:hypothetical protein [Aliarcobacter butzleri]|uniref:hypothetical protein n=1 Tax=Aliarcobacter butzleri TaxID=28197 RepID=UPI00396B2AD8
MVAQKETVLDDYAFLVSETDKDGVILFANSDFCAPADLFGQSAGVIRTVLK